MSIALTAPLFLFAGYLMVRLSDRIGRDLDPPHPPLRRVPAVMLPVFFTGLALAIQLKSTNTLDGLSLGVLSVALFGIALTDARFLLIPDVLSIGGTALLIALAALPGGPALGHAALGAALAALGMWALSVLGRLAFRKEAMGSGDILVLMLVGAYTGATLAVATLVLACLIALPASLIGAVRGKEHFPFALYLSLAAGIVAALGPEMLSGYRAWLLGL